MRMARYLPLLLKMARWSPFTFEGYAARFRYPFLGWVFRMAGTFLRSLQVHFSLSAYPSRPC